MITLIPFQRLEARDTPCTICQRYQEQSNPDQKWLVWLNRMTLQPERIKQEAIRVRAAYNQAAQD